MLEIVFQSKFQKAVGYPFQYGHQSECYYRINDGGHVVGLYVKFEENKSMDHFILPKKLSYFEHLEDLYLVNLNLHDFPSFIVNIPSLKRLDLSKNEFFRTLPDTITNLTSLEYFNLQDITILHCSMDVIDSLKEIILKNNGKFPPFF